MPWKTSKAWQRLILGWLSLAKSNLSGVPYFGNMTADNFHIYFAIKDLKTWPKLFLSSLRIAQKNWVANHILGNMRDDDFHTYFALKDLQRLTKTDLRLFTQVMISHRNWRAGKPSVSILSFCCRYRVLGKNGVPPLTNLLPFKPFSEYLKKNWQLLFTPNSQQNFKNCWKMV